jgi:hypothetical protein
MGWYQTEGTEFGGEGGSGSWFTAEDFDVDCVGKEVL